jgi:hypothetical protein
MFCSIGRKRASSLCNERKQKESVVVLLGVAEEWERERVRDWRTTFAAQNTANAEKGNSKSSGKNRRGWSKFGDDD